MVLNSYPDDLLEAQQALHRTYEALAASHPRHTTALRRDLLRLSTVVLWHPFWSAFPGSSSAARVQLRRQARSRQARQAV
ncbi:MULTISPECIES: hypothetical protein [Streptomyces]|uniref:Uncharacterized protein n=1 Tax=Streptomyces rimosus subsp. rimosus (strain ATCC 10970 / DSM 40260 / JCM 4667 / NRRL 2234) TaxID=1265868 RepID=A0A8A1UVK1_STRR1|nr:MULTISPECIES: hypothetical protein [Streptomyces]MYT41843.1 hypothetical protein [Streptomyces sp. SID5471]QDA02907.1 hypothetical protein CTZ40_03120 [Streptomyces rimosus]QEV74178.1 hypothetical protein CP984_03100 [Streptomyces rimosus]QGY68661.1 hypothetical protein V519_024520 [Streptomyces rimosus R6-500]QST85066.1 hypothetical protein SRIM_037435 [Streptomyces rimosus subsp. rimosus ATCC 10970]